MKRIFYYSTWLPGNVKRIFISIGIEIENGFILEVGMSAYSTMRNNAKRRGLAFDLTPSEVKYYRSLTKCQATGCTLNINEPSADNPKRLTIDRINNNFGYVRGNIATVCWAVNTRKGVFEAKGCKPRFTYKYITNDGWYFKYKHGKNTWMKID